MNDGLPIARVLSTDRFVDTPIRILDLVFGPGTSFTVRPACCSLPGAGKMC